MDINKATTRAEPETTATTRSKPEQLSEAKENGSHVDRTAVHPTPTNFMPITNPVFQQACTHGRLTKREEGRWLHMRAWGEH